MSETKEIKTVRIMNKAESIKLCAVGRVQEILEKRGVKMDVPTFNIAMQAAGHAIVEMATRDLLKIDLNKLYGYED
ncbi:MAG: hypothetical protein Unbinned8454contig1000_17 [Prokaryotic dsDNA virus sp.]|nr:MAG: hypothetical protein Unbinned8454contig1000_17 [Prokaryotic dsDNA virus sp.]|tara:strand:+ start:11453 stop:11680 length:228 start_codon:yes stop_codon:yes gene_type:complete